MHNLKHSIIFQRTGFPGTACTSSQMSQISPDNPLQRVTTGVHLGATVPLVAAYHKMILIDLGEIMNYRSQ